MPAKLGIVCWAVTHFPLPLPPWQLPAVGCIFPDQPSLTEASGPSPEIGLKLNQLSFKQFTGSAIVPRFVQDIPRLVEYCKLAPSNLLSISQNTLKDIYGYCKPLKSKQGLCNQEASEFV